MAKLSARGAHVLAKFEVRNANGARLLIALRSDGHVLRRVTHDREGRNVGGGYKDWGKMEVPTPERLRAVLVTRGYEILKETT